jgi:PPOX class probable F420-dependent enzyme
MNELDSARYCSLATWRRDGREVRTPVWFSALDGHRCYVFSAADAGKVKRIRRSPRAAVAICDARGGQLQAWRPARAYLVEDAAEVARAYELLHRKYGWLMTLTNALSRLAGRYHKRAMIRVEVEPGS